jgi:hypothetical protein
MAKSDERSSGYADRPKRSLTTPTYGLTEPSGTARAEMYRDGMRYGDPEMPRYCTGRRDGAAPEFPWPSGDHSEVGRQRRGKS